MKIAIVAGCPNSGWEPVCSVLEELGLDPAGDEIMQWLEEICPHNSGLGEEGVDAIHPEQGMFEKIKGLLENSDADSLSLADSRNLRMLDFWAEKFPRAVFLLFYTDAEIAIAHAIYQGHDPKQFMIKWQDANRHLLEFQRRHRRRVLLFDSYAAIAKPFELITACKRIGVTLQRPEYAIVAPVPSLLPLERLIAACFVSYQPSMQLLKSELEASALPLGDKLADEHLNPEEVFDDYSQRRVKEHTLLQLMDERDAAMKKLTDDHRRQLDELESTCRKERDAHENTEQEKELVLKQLRQGQEELEAVFLQKHRLESDLQRTQQLQKELQAKAKEIGEQDRFLIMVKESVFWKIAAPVRAMLKPIGRKAKIKAGVSQIKESGLFSIDWYLSRYPDVKEAGMDPIEHYLRHGAAEGRDPSPNFNSRKYWELNPDVAEAGMNPLLHYIQFGRIEGRDSGI